MVKGGGIVLEEMAYLCACVCVYILKGCVRLFE